MTKSTAKAKVLKVHPKAFACRTFRINARTYVESQSLWAVYKTWRSSRPMGYATAEKQAWANAAANLKKGTK